MRNARSPDKGRAKPEGSRKSRLRLLFWAALCSLIVGAIGLGEPVENLLRDVRSVVRKHPASGELAIVAIDPESLRQLEKWPWPRRHYAAIVDNLTKMGARQIFFDVEFSSTSDPANDSAFAAALKRTKPKVTLPVHFAVDPISGKRADLLPIDSFRSETELASITTHHNFRGEIRKLFYSVSGGGRTYPLLATKMAGVSGPVGETYPIDFAIDPRSIPTVSAVDVIAGRADVSKIAGKKVMIAATAAQLGDLYLVPGYGILSGIYVQALGAETLLAGTPLVLGWLLPLLAALAIGGSLIFLKDVRVGAVTVAAAAVSFSLIPIALEDRHIFADVVPSLLFLFTVSGFLAWSSFKRFYRARGSINAISGLPNLNVLREEATGRDFALIVAKIHNYAEITSALSTEGEERLVQQVAERLLSLSGGAKLYQGDEGIFAWFDQAQGIDGTAADLDAGFDLFRSPIFVRGNQVDATVTFGIDARIDKPLASRLGSALVAADDALRDGLKWKKHDPSRSEDLAWKLSLLSQLDQAIDGGDLWIAFQPKMDLVSRKIVSAEALARWNHPEKGPINPIEFILAAEQSGRIGKLTDHVLGRSIEAAARIKRQGVEFSIAVNLSARLIHGMGLTATVSRLLAQHDLAPHCLTLEITETAALAGGGRDLDTLNDLRSMGVQLSIDDYGTGQSTLDYMKRIPATEIKIDKSFVEAIEKSRSDRLMVHSTIQLAHSLGQKVVAEGVERSETLEMLALMGCDLAQGYLIGRPVPITELEESLIKQRRAA